MPQVQANGMEIYYEEVGKSDAPVILLVMGLGTQMIAWPEDFVKGLADSGFRVVSFDNRDIGKSTYLDGAPSPNLIWAMFAVRLGLPLKTAYSLTDMASDAAALLDALDVRQAHIVGASMGGMIAQIMSAKWPDRVLSLTSVMSSSGAPGLPGPSPELRKRLMQRPPRSASRDEVIAFGTETLKAIAFPDPARPSEAFQEMAARAYDRGYNPKGMRRQLAAIIADGNRSARLAGITVPTLVVHGAADTLVPLACGKDVAGKIPGARMEVIDDMAHDLPPSQIPRMVELISGHVGAV